MRKSTQKVATAFLAGKSAKMGNIATDGQSLYLFGNLIAKRQHNGISVTLAGWNTPTTREKLNAIPGVNFNTKAGQAHFNGQPCDSQDWFTVADTRRE